jgi:hypothetical protein
MRAVAMALAVLSVCPAEVKTATCVNGIRINSADTLINQVQRHFQKTINKRGITKENAASESFLT